MDDFKKRLGDILDEKPSTPSNPVREALGNILGPNAPSQQQSTSDYIKSMASTSPKLGSVDVFKNLEAASKNPMIDDSTEESKGLLGSAMSYGLLDAINPDLKKSVVYGTKSALGKAKMTYQSLSGDYQGVIDEAKDQNELSKTERTQGIKDFESTYRENVERYKAQGEEGLWKDIKSGGTAIAQHPGGLAEFIAEQAPNSVPAMAAGWAGMKGGALLGGKVGTLFAPVTGGLSVGIGAAVGGVLGGAAGMFLGTGTIELGAKAQEAASDGTYEYKEAKEVHKEAAIKSAAITGVDIATLGISRVAMGAINRAAVRAGSLAEAQVLYKATGILPTDTKALNAVLLANPALRETAKIAGREAAIDATTFGMRSAAAATGMTLETVGEGLGEYLGEGLASGTWDTSEAVLEAIAGFAMSSAETAYNLSATTAPNITTKDIGKYASAAAVATNNGALAEREALLDTATNQPYTNPEVKKHAEEIIALRKAGNFDAAAAIEQQLKTLIDVENKKAEAVDGKPGKPKDETKIREAQDVLDTVNSADEAATQIQETTPQAPTPPVEAQETPTPTEGITEEGRAAPPIEQKPLQPSTIRERAEQLVLEGVNPNITDEEIAANPEALIAINEQRNEALSEADAAEEVEAVEREVADQVDMMGETDLGPEQGSPEKFTHEDAAGNRYYEGEEGIYIDETGDEVIQDGNIVPIIEENINAVQTEAEAYVENVEAPQTEGTIEEEVIEDAPTQGEGISSEQVPPDSVLEDTAENTTDPLEQTSALENNIAESETVQQLTTLEYLNNYSAAEIRKMAIAQGIRGNQKIDEIAMQLSGDKPAQYKKGAGQKQQQLSQEASDVLKVLESSGADAATSVMILDNAPIAALKEVAESLGKKDIPKNKFDLVRFLVKERQSSKDNAGQKGSERTVEVAETLSPPAETILDIDPKSPSDFVEPEITREQLNKEMQEIYDLGSEIDNYDPYADDDFLASEGAPSKILPNTVFHWVNQIKTYLKNNPHINNEEVFNKQGFQYTYKQYQLLDSAIKQGRIKPANIDRDTVQSMSMDEISMELRIRDLSQRKEVSGEANTILEREVENIKSKIVSDEITVIYVKSDADLPTGLQEASLLQGSANGWFSIGEGGSAVVYLIGNNIDTTARIRKVPAKDLIHEVISHEIFGHFGLYDGFKKLLGGTNPYHNFLEKEALRNKKLLMEAAKSLMGEGRYLKYVLFAKPNDKNAVEIDALRNGKPVKAWIPQENFAKVLDEYIALRGEAIPRGGFSNEQQHSSFWKRLYGIIRHGLRKLGRVNLNNSDIDQMLMASHDYLMGRITSEQRDKALLNIIPTQMLEEINGVGFIPVDERDSIQAMFLGKGATTANEESYNQAQVLEARGSSNKEIWEQTGWFRGVDGVLRYQITDKDAELTEPSKIINKTGSTLGSVLSHVELFNAYESLKDVKVKTGINPGNGKYDPSTDTITVSEYDIENRPDRLLKILLHEAQHAIQYREGFAVGGSSVNFFPTYQELKRIGDLAKKRIDRLVLESLDGTDFTSYEQAENEINLQQKNGIVSKDEAKQLRTLFNKRLSNLKSNLAFKYAIKQMDAVPASSQFDWAYEQYMRLAGEAEARLVEITLENDRAGIETGYPMDAFDIDPSIQSVEHNYDYLMASEMDELSSANITPEAKKVHKKVQSEQVRYISALIDARNKGEGKIQQTALATFAEQVTEYVRNTWVGKYWSALGDMKHQDIYNYADNILKGEIQAAEDFAKKIERATNKTTPIQNEQIMKFFTTKDATIEELLNVGLTQQQADLMSEAKQNIINFGADLVKLGKLSNSVFEDSKGSYLPYMYLKYAEKSFSPGGKKTSFLEFLKKRGDLNPLDRDALGKIENPNIVLPKFLGTIGRDVALLKMGQTTIELNNQYGLGWILGTAKKIDVRRRSSKGKPIRMNEYEIAEKIEEIQRHLQDGVGGPVFGRTAEANQALQEELEHFKRLGVLAKAYRFKEVKDILLKSGVSKDDITPERVEKFLDSEFKRLPNSQEFGAFRGKYVHRGIYNDFIEMDDVIKSRDGLAANILGTGGFYARAHTYWKGSKVVMNIPVSTVRNVMGAITQLDTSTKTSLPILLKNLAGELASVINDYTESGEVSEWWVLGKRFGLHGATFSAAELSSLNRTKIMRIKREMELQGKEQTFSSTMKNLFGKSTEGINFLFEEASKIYGLQEALFKTVAMRDYVETYIDENGKDKWKAMSDMEKEVVYSNAAVKANEAIYDYTRVPPWVKVMRKLPIGGAPFITFAYKAGPQSAKNVIAHPVKHLKYAALGYVLAQAAMEAFDWDDDELEWYQKNLNKAFKDFGTMYILPWKDAQGRPQFINLEYLFPWSQWWKASKKIGEGVASGDVDKALTGLKGAIDEFGLLSGPAMDYIYTAETGEMKFGGKSIISPESTSNADKINDILRWQVSMWFPPILTSNGALGKYLDYLGVEPTPINAGVKYNKMFQPKETAGQVASRVIGLNTYGRSPQELQLQNQKAFEFSLKKFATQRSKVIQNPNISQAEKQRKIREINEMQRFEYQSYMK